jgi:hypothetical protein
MEGWSKDHIWSHKTQLQQHSQHYQTKANAMLVNPIKIILIKKYVVLSEAAPYNPLEVHKCFRGTCCPHTSLIIHRPDDGGSKHL